MRVKEVEREKKKKGTEREGGREARREGCREGGSKDLQLTRCQRQFLAKKNYKDMLI